MDKTEFEELEIKLIDTLEEEGYNGVDMSLETSLFEYGLLCKPSDDKKEYDLIVGVNVNEDSSFKSFSYDSISKQFLFDFFRGKEWASKEKLKGFYESNDITKKQYLIMINEFSPMIINDLFSYWGAYEFIDQSETDHIFLEDYQKECLDEYFEELEDLESELKDLETELEDRDEFNRDDYYNSFDESLDDGDSITVAGIEFEPSDILKECDPTAYRCYFNDYVSYYEDEENDKISEMEQDITDKKEEVTDKEQEIQSELEEISQIELEEE
jgi:hypothetical protein